MVSKSLLISFLIFLTGSSQCEADDCQLPISDWGIYGTNKTNPYHFEFLSLIQTNSKSGKKTISHYIRNVGGSAPLPVEWIKGHIPNQVIAENDCSFNTLDTFSPTTIDPDGPITYDIGGSKSNDAEVYARQDKQNTSTVAHVQEDPLVSTFFTHIPETKEAIKLSFTCGFKEGKLFYELRNLLGRNVQLTIPELTTAWRAFLPGARMEGWVDDKIAGQTLDLPPNGKWSFTSTPDAKNFRETIVLINSKSATNGKLIPAGFISVLLPFEPR